MVSARNELVPIRTVSQITGVNPVTLRAWERRYGLVKPKRTPKGHRLYSRNDIDLINRVLALLDRGMSIGQVRNALENESVEVEPSVDDDTWALYRRRMLGAITRFDEAELEEVYNETLALYPVSLVTRRLVVPLLEDLGLRWEQGEGSVAEEHFFGSYLRNKLGARFHHRPRQALGDRLIMACLPDEYHEIGLLLVALAASNRGYDIVLLGANMPLEELPSAVEQARADAIVLSGSTRPGEEAIRQRLAPVVESANVPVFVGGYGPSQIADLIASVGAIPLGSDLDSGLRTLTDHMDRRRGQGYTPRRRPN